MCYASIWMDVTAESLLKWNQTVGLGTKNCLFAAAKLFLNRILMLNILLKLVKWHYLETWKYICHESGVLLCWTLSMFLLHGSLMVNMMMTTMMTQLWEKIVLKTFKVAYEWVAWQLWWYKSPKQIWDAIFQTHKQQEAFPRTLSSKSVIYI